MSSIMDMLSGGAPQGPPPPGADPSQAPGGGGGGVAGQPDNADAEQALQDAIDALQNFLDAEEDDQDKSVASQCLAKLQGIFGGRQKQNDAASGITPVHKAMGRAMKQQQGQGGY